MFPAGSNVELDIKLGKRKIYLLGLYSKDGACQKVSEIDTGIQLQNQFSRPLVTASAEITVVNGPNSLQMTNSVLPVGSRSSQILSECKFSSTWQPADLPYATEKLYWLDQSGAPDTSAAGSWNFNSSYAPLRASFPGLVFTSGSVSKSVDSAGIKTYSFTNNDSNMHKSATALNSDFAFSFVVNINVTETGSAVSYEKVIFKLKGAASTSNSMLRISSKDNKLIAIRPVDAELDPGAHSTPNTTSVDLLNLTTGLNKIMITVAADYANQKYVIYVNNNLSYSIPARLISSGSNTSSDYVLFGTPSPTGSYYSFNGHLLADVVLYYSTVNSIYQQKMFQYYKQKYPSYMP